MTDPSRRAALLAATSAVLTLAGCSTIPDAPHRASVTLSPETARTAEDAFDRAAHSIDADSSPWIIVNKRRPLRATYIPHTVRVPVAHTNPPLLRPAARTAVIALFTAARREGIHLASNSTYRSYTDQRSVYNGNLQRLGRAKADHLTAHPGCSEHQTGLAIDIGPLSGQCSLNVCMGDLPEGRWLATHAWEHGFLLRYPSNKVAITGYQYEPWHFRYLGHPLATELHHTGITTLEEFFDLPAAPNYE